MSGEKAGAIDPRPSLISRMEMRGSVAMRKRANKRPGCGRETMTWIRAITPYKCRPFDSQGQSGEVHTETQDARTISAQPLVYLRKGGSLSAPHDGAPRLALSP